MRKTTEPTAPALPQQLMQLTRVQETFDISPKTARRLIQRGELTAYRVGQRILVDPAELVALAAAKAGR